MILSFLINYQILEKFVNTLSKINVNKTFAGEQTFFFF